MEYILFSMDDQNINTQPNQTINTSSHEIVGESKVDAIIRIESIIKKNLFNIMQLQEDVKMQNDMLNDIFENDKTFKDHADKAKMAIRQRNSTKMEIMRQSQAATVVNKIKDLKDELKDLKKSLSDYVLEFNRVSGLNQITDSDGKILEIVYSTKLVRKSGKDKP